MTCCDVFDCGMPVAGIVYSDLNPGPDSARLRLCTSHLEADMRRRLDLRQPFAVGPFRVVAGRAAA